jgi:predicted DNA-binding transcriptional regulator YafY
MSSASIINDIIQAAFERKLLRILYFSDADFIPSYRYVEVYSDHRFGTKFYIYAYDVDKNDTIRLYLLDRILGTKVLSVPFSPRWEIAFEYL